MSGKCFAFLISAFLAVGCARPNYQSPNSINTAFSKTCEISFQQAKICSQIVWEKPPATSVYGAFQLHLTPSQENETLQDSTIELQVSLWMPSMGHGSSPVQVEKLAVDHFRASQVYFIMPGEWEIQFQIKSHGNVIDQSTKNIHL